MTIREEIEQLKKEKNAVILAHYYVRPEVQEIADYVGDSFYLSKVAVGLKEKTIVFCGVSFMGESAKILNPEKTVLMPDMAADCPMAHMASAETIEKIRSEYDDLAVVCYINSTAELKRHSDVCVTSSNAVKIVKALPNKNIHAGCSRVKHPLNGTLPWLARFPDNCTVWNTRSRWANRDSRSQRCPHTTPHNKSQAPAAASPPRDCAPPPAGYRYPVR